MEVSGQLHAPEALPRGGAEQQVPIAYETGWVPEPVWTLQRMKILH
jgi:hypothetical protein